MLSMCALIAARSAARSSWAPAAKGKAVRAKRRTKEPRVFKVIGVTSECVPNEAAVAFNTIRGRRMEGSSGLSWFRGFWRPDQNDPRNHTKPHETKQFRLVCFEDRFSSC